MARRTHSKTSSKSPARTLGCRTLVLDNGSDTLKAGFAPSFPDCDSDADTDADTSTTTTTAGNTNPSLRTSRRSPPPAECEVVPNCIARTRQKTTHLGPRVRTIVDRAELTLVRPMEQGMITNWALQSAIWEETFFSRPGAIRGGGTDSSSSTTTNNNNPLFCDPHETNLLMTQPANCLAALESQCDQMVFEEFEFAGYWRTVPARLNVYGQADFSDLAPDDPAGPPSWPAPAPAPTSFSRRPLPAPPRTAAPTFLLVDAGFVSTTVTPVLSGRVVQSAVRRLDLGGKHLTAFLREQLSVRNFSLQDETALVAAVKERVCFAAPSGPAFAGLMDRAWKGGGLDGGVVAEGGDEEDADGRTPPVSIRNGRFDRSVFVDVVLPDYEHSFTIATRPHSLHSSYRSRRLLAGPAPAAATPTGPLPLAPSAAAGEGNHDGHDGRPAPAEFVLPVGNERFRTPELLFSPGDVGLAQAGLHQVVAESVAAVRFALATAGSNDTEHDSDADAGDGYGYGEAVGAALLANVRLVGGTAATAGLASRLRHELRQASGEGVRVRVGVCDDPVVQTWRAGAGLAAHQPDFVRTQLLVSRQEYFEHGPGWLGRKFLE